MKTFRRALLLTSPTAQQADPLVRSFLAMMAQRQPNPLEDWLTLAEHSQIAEFKRFAWSLRGD